MDSKSKPIDIKSLIIGLLVGCCLFMWLGDRGKDVPKYQLGDNGAILETDTGNLWYRRQDSLMDFGTPQEPSYNWHPLPELYVVDGKKMTIDEYEEHEKKVKAKLIEERVDALFAELDEAPHDPNKTEAP